MAKQTSELFSKKGNTAGFTSAGEVVCAHYERPSQTWKVQTGDRPSPTFDNIQTFETAREADEYARSIIDIDKSRELAWWNFDESYVE